MTRKVEQSALQYGEIWLYLHSLQLSLSARVVIPAVINAAHTGLCRSDISSARLEASNMKQFFEFLNAIPYRKSSRVNHHRMDEYLISSMLS